MDYTRISDDCHIDLPWIPPGLFVTNASATMKDRMPYVAEGPDDRYWTSKNGGSFGLVTTGAVSARRPSSSTGSARS